ncbi:MAG: DNA repair protein RecO [Mycoplasma sp.]
MASTTTINGYLISTLDFGDFDQIITFLSEEGNLYPCLSKGSRKLESKNRSQLRIGNFCQFEVFLARHKDKMSRLKKCKAINEADWRLGFFQPFNLLVESIQNSNFKNKALYNYFVYIYELLKTEKYSEKELILITLEKFCLLNGISLEVNKCVECGTTKQIHTLSLKKHGFVCHLHFDKKTDYEFSVKECKLFHHLFNEQYDELKNFSKYFDFIIKILKQYIKDNLGVNFSTLNNY